MPLHIEENDVTVQICDCCLIWLANRDASGCSFHCLPVDFNPPNGSRDDYHGPSDAHPNGLGGADTLGQYDHVVTDDDRDEFSTARCDGCGTNLAGARTLGVII